MLNNAAPLSLRFVATDSKAGLAVGRWVDENEGRHVVPCF